MIIEFPNGTLIDYDKIDYITRIKNTHKMRRRGHPAYAAAIMTTSGHVNVVYQGSAGDVNSFLFAYRVSISNMPERFSASISFKTFSAR